MWDCFALLKKSGIELTLSHLGEIHPIPGLLRHLLGSALAQTRTGQSGYAERLLSHLHTVDGDSTKVPVRMACRSYICRSHGWVLLCRGAVLVIPAAREGAALKPSGLHACCREWNSIRPATYISSWILLAWILWRSGEFCPYNRK